ncbi:MAG TPA: 50S ribosomal protein L29 [Caldisericia bacterium]|jgi:large subunit ribosomal protein L29|nr:50S ribosomal protein L29 [Caldisericia bacterium]
MKLYKIKEMGVEELQKKLHELKKEIFFLRFKLQLQQVEKPLEIRNIRRDIRRIETILRERTR